MNTLNSTTQRHSRKAESLNGSEKLPLNPASSLRNQSFESSDKPKSYKKMEKKIALVFLVCTFILFSVGGDTSTRNNNIYGFDNGTINHAELLSNERMKDNVMSTFTKNIQKDVDKDRQITNTKSSYISNSLRRNKDKKSVNFVKSENVAVLSYTATQLIDALKHGEDGKYSNVQLKITVNEKDVIPKRPSGLKVSPGIPLPNQKLNSRSAVNGRKIYKPTKKLLSKIETFPHQIADLNCALYNGPGEITTQRSK